uniref:Secreted protein n=1 Tax=Panagrellus redivivus TaxID=6233 RepID=A0A7E4UYT5_PANRE
MNGFSLRQFAMIFFACVLVIAMVAATDDEPKRASPLLSRYGRAVLSRYGKRSLPLVQVADTINGPDYEYVLCRRIVGDMLECFPTQ